MMPPESDKVSTNTTPSSPDDSNDLSHVDPSSLLNHDQVPIESVADDDPNDYNANGDVDTTESATQVSRGVSSIDVFHTMAARIAHSNATLKATTERQFNGLKNSIDENFDKMAVAMDVMNMTTQQNGRDITDAINDMTEMNAKTNMMTRNTSTQLEDLIKQMSVLNKSMIDALQFSQNQAKNQVNNIVPSQVISSTNNNSNATTSATPSTRNTNQNRQQNQRTNQRNQNRNVSGRQGSQSSQSSNSPAPSSTNVNQSVQQNTTNSNVPATSSTQPQSNQNGCVDYV